MFSATNQLMIIVFITSLMLTNYSKYTIKEQCRWLPRSKTDPSVYDPSKLTYCRDLGKKYGKKGRQGRVVFGVPPKAHIGGQLSKADLRHLGQQSKSIGRFLFPAVAKNLSFKVLEELKVVGHGWADALPATVVASAESIFYSMDVAKVLIVLDMGRLCARDQFCKAKVKNLRQQNRILVFFVNYNRGQNSFDDFEFVKSNDLIDNLRFNEMLADCVCKILDDGGHLVGGDSTTTTLSTITTHIGKIAIKPDDHVIVFGADNEGGTMSRSPLFLILILCCSAGAVLTILIAVLVLYSCREKHRRSSTTPPKTPKSKTDSATDDVESNKNRKAKNADKAAKNAVPEKTTTTLPPTPKNNSNDRLYLKSSEYSPTAPSRDQTEIKTAKKDADHVAGKIVKGPIKKKMQNYEVLQPQPKIIK